ncbi:MAG: methyl-accepting chemotaxis protein [Methylococcaceae bacterium]
MFTFGKSRLMSDSLHKVKIIVDRIRTGEAPVVIDLPPLEENQELAHSLRKLQEKTDELRAKNADMSCLKLALDVTSTCTMVADEGNNIIYMNRTAKELFRVIETDLRKDLPDFNVDRLIGTNIDVFHKDPSHQKRLLERLTTTFRSELKVGGRVLEIIANPISGENGQRLGTVVEWADRTREIQQKEREEQLAKEGLRLRNALDNTSTNVMVADETNTIIYMNTTAREMFKAAEPELRRSLPHFRADQLMGVNMDVFHKDPTHQRRIVDRLNGTHQSQVQVGNGHFQIIANPILDSDGKRHGTVVEWANKTNEVNAQQDIQRLVESIKAGELHSRIQLDDKTGFFRLLCEELNKITEILDYTFKDFGKVIKSMAEGNLTRKTGYDEYQGYYEVMRADIVKTQHKLSEVFAQIRQTADFIYNASQEIATGNNNLSHRAEQQAASLEQTASSMEELTHTVKNNAENSIQANQVSIASRQLAEKGGDVVNRAVAAMSEINASSSKIANIISTIDEIAFQTNLLALNASVEAARAGEQGRGFAVVATEVRNLAQRSAKAAKESRELIQNSLEKVSGGSSLVTESGMMLTQIVDGVVKVGDLVSQIASASKDQAEGIQQVNQAVAQMDEITQQNAALAEQASAASVSMCEQANNMVRLLSFFKTHDSQSESRGADLSDRGRYADASSTQHSKSGGRS